MFCLYSLQALNGFLCVVLQKGLIIYVSDSISEILGHNPVRFKKNTLFVVRPHEINLNRTNLKKLVFCKQPVYEMPKELN